MLSTTVQTTTMAKTPLLGTSASSTMAHQFLIEL